MTEQEPVMSDLRAGAGLVLVLVLLQETAKPNGTGPMEV